MADVFRSEAGRRRILRWGGAAALGHAWPRLADGQVPSRPETATVRLCRSPAICLAPSLVVEDFLRAEGFRDVVFVEAGAKDPVDLVDGGRADFAQDGAPVVIPRLAAGAVVAFAGLHAGCYELFAHRDVRSLSDLRGRRVAVMTRGGAEQLFVSTMLSYIGLDPARDVEWMYSAEWDEPMRLFVTGQVDAFIGFPPQPQKLRSRGIGHVLVDTATDRPWAHHFCCFLVGRRAFAQNHPIATRKVLRAFLMAADLCAREPVRVARLLRDRQYEPEVEISLEVLRKLSFNRWRDSDPAATIRFYALRLKEAGLLDETPNRLLESGTDWRFLRQLQRELRS